MKNIADVYELSPLQKGILFYSILNSNTESYFQQMNFRLTGPLTTAAFKSAWQQVTGRYPVLRTSFHWEGLEKPVQIVRTQIELPWQELDWTDKTEEDTETALASVLANERSRPFVFDQAPLLRFILIKISGEVYHFVWNYHHLLLDGWSLPILLKEVFDLYGGTVKNMPVSLQPVRPYRDYIIWLQEQPADAAAAFWKKEMTGAEHAGLLFDGAAANTGKHTPAVYAHQYGTLDIPAFTDLKQAVRRHRLTLSTVIQAAWAITLSHYSGSQQVVFGYTVSGRSGQVKDIEKMAGLFINTLPVSVDLAGVKDVLPWLHTLQQKQQEKEQFGYVSLADIHLYSDLPKNRRIIESMIAFENYPLNKAMANDIAGLQLSRISFFEQTDIPVTLIITPDETLDIKCIYDTAIYSEGQVGLLMNNFLLVLEEMSKGIGTDMMLSDMGLMPPGEQQKWLKEWNQREEQFSGAGKGIHHLFEAQVEKTPEATALVCGHERVSYRELNERAGRMAHYFLQQGIGNGDVIAVCQEHSVRLLVCILAILKTGAAYLPLDPEHPQDRRSYILKDAQCRMIITDTDAAELEARSADNVMTNPVVPFHDEQTGYIIYTSGSTGLPKGVLVKHVGIVNYISWAATYYTQGERLAFPLYTSLAFDLTVTSIFTPLVTGGSLHIYKATGNAPVLEKVLAENEVDIIKVTPSHLRLIRDRTWQQSRVRSFIVGGEAFETSLADAILHNFNGKVALYNEYGPTEATVGCMIHRYDPAKDKRSTVPVGVPISNMHIYILNGRLKPVPYSAAGEVFIGGAGVAGGYLNRAELNKERFITDAISGEVLYRTGDMARFLPGGNLELLGRTDRQVKFKGFRIELEEVEQVVRQIDGITNAAVVLRDLRNKPVKAPVQYCVKCGMPSNYPDIRFNTAGICNVCEGFATYREKAYGYFRKREELRTLFETHRKEKEGEYDCLMLLSGGKDSTYVLYQLVKEMGLRPLVFSLDNGYISEGAKENMRAVAKDLGVELIFGTVAGMNEIFADSLREFSNVCNGCFKTIYTLSMQLAKQKNIRYIVTGLSRGQLYETRLHDLFCANTFDAAQIDELVLRSRIAYHKKEDAVSRLMDVSIFEDEQIFRDIQFIDFYRYWDVSLDEMYTYLNQHAPWVRPSDTGRSTNCLVNDVGIYIHKKEKGFHNYALPYSWDVRMEHKNRDAALKELDDELNIPRIKQMLQEIGYDENSKDHRPELQLIAYYTTENGSMSAAVLREKLSERLPSFMMPTLLLETDRIPLTTNGKISYDELPEPSRLLGTKAMFTAPRNETEQQLATIWKEVLGVDHIDIRENMFDMGGHSLLLNLVHSRIMKIFGNVISMVEMFEYPTIEAMAIRLNGNKADEEEVVVADMDTREQRQDLLLKRRQGRQALRHSDDEN